MKAAIGLVGFGAILCGAGLLLSHWYPPTLEWRDLLLDSAETSSAPGAVTTVEPTAWEMPAKREGLLPLPVYRVVYRYGLEDGRNLDGASYSTGLYHRVRDTVTVQYLVSDPSISRAHRTTLAPRGPLGLVSGLLPVVGLLVLLVGAALAWKRRSVARS